MNDYSKLEHIIEQLDGSTEDPKKKNIMMCGVVNVKNSSQTVKVGNTSLAIDLL